MTPAELARRRAEIEAWNASPEGQRMARMCPLNATERAARDAYEAEIAANTEPGDDEDDHLDDEDDEDDADPPTTRVVGNGWTEYDAESTHMAVLACVRDVLDRDILDGRTHYAGYAVKLLSRLRDAGFAVTFAPDGFSSRHIMTITAGTSDAEKRRPGTLLPPQNAEEAYALQRARNDQDYRNWLASRGWGDTYDW